jgi:cytochrome c oxidase accessory protein FixG
VVRTGLKHALFLGVSWGLAHVALAFFLSWHELGGIMREGPWAHPTAFGWAMAVTGALYYNYAFFREQLCVVVCPYGRLQSAMQDADSVIIGYDTKRGDPRGKLLKNPMDEERGDCVDCLRCVQVCPTGIDIRNGLQMECLACAQCVDACDAVMDKIHKPRGLIRYDSLNGLSGKPKRVLRPRLFAYGGLLAVSVLGLGIALGGRTPFEANVLRMPGPPYVLEGDTLRNQFELHVVNKHPTPATFHVKVEAPRGVSVIVPRTEMTLGSLESDNVSIVVTAPRSFALPAKLEVEITDGLGQERELELKVVGPYRAPKHAG